MEVNYLKKEIEGKINELEEKIEELETMIEEARNALDEELGNDELHKISEKLDAYI